MSERCYNWYCDNRLCKGECQQTNNRYGGNFPKPYWKQDSSSTLKQIETLNKYLSQGSLLK